MDINNKDAENSVLNRAESIADELYNTNLIFNNKIEEHRNLFAVDVDKNLALAKELLAKEPTKRNMYEMDEAIINIDELMLELKKAEKSVKFKVNDSYHFETQEQRQKTIGYFKSNRTFFTSDIDSKAILEWKTQIANFQ